MKIIITVEADNKLEASKIIKALKKINKTKHEEYTELLDDMAEILHCYSP